MLDRLDPGDDDRLVDAALAWAAARRGPYFLYVHLMDAHTPYRKAPIDGRRRRGRHIQFPRSGMPITAEEAEDVRARYAGGVRSAAEQAARVVSTLASGPRPVLAVVTADHGESLGEEGRWFHNYTLAGELLAVPLLVHGEGVQPGAVEPGVGHASVGKTLLAAAGVDTGALAGSDLRTSDGEAAVEGALPSDLSYRIVDGYKVVMDHRRQTAALFDLRADPEERRDLAGARPEMVRLVAAARLRPAPPAVSAGDLERLKAFGYGSPAALRGPGPPAGGR
jgi:arylsulfatase A-like enzyme